MVSVADAADDRSAVAAGIVGTGGFPDCFSGCLIESDEIAGAVVVSVYDYFVLPDCRARAVSVPAGERAGTDFPEHFAFEIIRGDEHFVAVEEADVNPFAVGGGCRGCVAVKSMELLERRDEDDFLVEDFSVFSVEGEEDSLALFLESGDEEDAVFPDYRGCMSFAGKGRFPDDILRIAPLDRDVFLNAGAIPARSSPGGPVLGVGEGRESGDQGY